MDMYFTRLDYMSSTSGVLCEAATTYLSRVPWFHPQFFFVRSVMFMFLVFYDMCLFFSLVFVIMYPMLSVSLHLSILDCSSFSSTVYLS